MAELNSELEKTYHRRFDTDLEYRAFIWKILVENFFARYVRPEDRVLDLGCGYGQFINQIVCSKRFAMDLNPASRSAVDANVVFLEQDCSALWPLPSSSLDVVFSSNFFEHLPTKDHLKRTLEEVHRCLRPGGLLIAMGPNAKYVPGAYWDFFDHHIALTELSMQEALEITGFQMVEVIGRFLPYTMVNAPKYPGIFLKLYLKLRFTWRWVGGQFLVVAAKR
ncbi:MAG TPA: class I SAM-dependent methyltransferase [Candidatus Angelobacter sp.]|nr:class I SAM-dependent methyltransferase [Candidatus Angelobacter sp.]